jgi:hypothetical protein
VRYLKVSSRRKFIPRNAYTRNYFRIKAQKKLKKEHATINEDINDITIAIIV